LARKGQGKRVDPGHPAGSAGLHQEIGASCCLETVRPRQQLRAVTTGRQLVSESHLTTPPVERLALVALPAVSGFPLGLALPEDRVRLRDDIERLLEVMVSDPFAVYVQLGEERPVQDAAYRLVARFVQLVRVIQ